MQEESPALDRSFYPFLRYERVGRVISSPPHLDGCILSAYATRLGRNYENEVKLRNLSANVTAYRTVGHGTGNIKLAKEVFDEIRRRPNCSVLVVDVRGFFDSISHDLLKRKWSALLSSDQLPTDQFKLFKTHTRSAVVELKQFRRAIKKVRSRRNPRPDRLCSPQEFREIVRGSGLIKRNLTERGIPQGSSLSCVLSNLFMLEFDFSMKKLSEEISGFYRRYSDDLAFICNSDDAPAVWEKIISSLAREGLNAHPSKSRNLTFDHSITARDSSENLHYLGFTFDGEDISIFEKTLERAKSNFYDCHFSKGILNYFRKCDEIMQSESIARLVQGVC